MGKHERDLAVSVVKEANSTEEILANNQVAKQFISTRSRIQNVVNKKNPLIIEYTRLYAEQEKNPKSYIGRIRDEMKKAIYYSELYLLAADNCEKEDDKNFLIQESEKYKNSPAVKNYMRYLDGLEYMSGAKEKLDPETEKFFRDELRAPIDKSELYNKYRLTEETKPKNNYEKNLQIYQRKIARAYAERIYAHKCCNQETINQQFFANYPPNKRRKVELMPDRMTPAAFCVSSMVRKGYSLDDILDPRKLIEEKQAFGEEYKAIRESADEVKYMNELYAGAEALKDAYEKYLIEHKDELKTERDLIHHSNRLAYLATTCFDLNQEMERCSSHYTRVDQSKEKVLHSIEDYTKMSFKLLELRIGNTLSTATDMNYEPDEYAISSGSYSRIASRNLIGKHIIEELNKDNPDYSQTKLSIDSENAVIMQMNSLPAFVELFNGSTDLKLENMSIEEIDKLAGLLNGSYFDKNKIKYFTPKVPITVKGTPETGEDLSGAYEGLSVDRVLFIGDKQVVETNIPAQMDKFLNSLNKGVDMRGNAKDNSAEFDNLLTNFDNVRKALENPQLNNEEYLAELGKLKTAAEGYILAKREQKGYANSSPDNKNIDAQMLGKAKGGSSIFTSRGKERYEFAATVLDAITETEKVFNQAAPEFDVQEKEQDGLEVGM